jgi:3-hydroxyacyl-CoA dehydrogenase
MAALDDEHKGDVAVLALNNPPVNALAQAVCRGLKDGLERALADTAVRAILVIGRGRGFCAGADISEFGKKRPPDAIHLRHIVAAFDGSTKPIVAAIHGNALGGGLELAMACHTRVALATARVGQPEVLLGLIPGAAGTQRLPRLCGVPLALEMCIGGKPVPAMDARAAGIVDEIVAGDREALVAGAIGVAQARADAHEIRRTRELVDRISDVEAALTACIERQAALEKARTPTLAPLAAVEAIKAAVTLPFDDGSVVERHLFADCLVSIESRALIHLFFAEREAAKVPGVPKGTAVRDIRRAAVVGAGTMGGGIAMTYANAGIPVVLKDVDEAALARGMETIRRNYEVSASKGRMTAEQLNRAMSLITPATSYGEFDQVDIVIEAVFEDLALKTATFAELGRVTRADCLLASNTSTLDIDRLAAASGRHGSVIGHHFFSPANVMKLLEIVRGSETSAETIATSQKLGKRLGKVGVVVGNGFGFVANRMLLQYLREAYLLLEEGAAVGQTDRVMMTFGMPVGPFGMEDIAGIDVGARIRQHLESSGAGGGWPSSDVANRLVEMGRFGQKTGAGWYRYEKGSRAPIDDPLIETLAIETAARRGTTRRAVTDEEILARLTTALANEGARLLDEGMATRAGDIDVIYCYGFGFPRYRGGPMFYADTVGLPTILARVREYRDRFGDHWQPAPLVERLVAEGRGFYTRA